ncbi:MAG: M1 family metallopeptidase [Chloroflexota bacterium]|nr:M1 family metallopeptidase [Chloroflexota bacterium]
MNDFRLSPDVRPRRYALRFDLDLAEWRSTGSARIDLDTAEPTKEIALHACEIEIDLARLDGEPAERISYDEDSQTAVLGFASTVARGGHTLDLEWHGGIREALRGLYRSVRDEERYAATQFEAADARRAFPCFDEPEFKARYAIELVHPAGLTAVGNMPIASQAQVDGGRVRTVFEETPPISSYLVAFTVGPYEATPVATTRTGYPVRVVVPPGLAKRSEYARDAHVAAVEWLEEYTQVPYQYRKVDAIGLPDFEAGAMENPGAITYRVRLLAADRETASLPVLKSVFAVAAHELTHMWWGDLVTMKWWNDLWLNESFASFVGDKCTDALNPEWLMKRDIVADAAPAFGLDALVSTHPISMEVRNVDEASERFDAITYNKGQAVLRMIEAFLGEDVFRDGVRIYLDRHREANATADDFWRALDEASAQDVTALANAWIREPGHPLVRCAVSEEGGDLVVALRQERFFADPGVADTGQTWPVPIVLAYGTPEGRKEERVLLRQREATVRLPRARWYFPNGGAAGFYRYAFDERSVGLLAPALAQLRPEERLSLLDDQWALVRARKAHVARSIELVAGLGGETDRAVLQALSEHLAWIAQYVVTPATQPDLRRLVASIFGPELARLGWERRPADTSDERERRSIAIAALGQRADDADVRREARRRLDAHLAGRQRLDPDIAGAVVAVAAAIGDAALYDRYVARMKESERTDAQEESRFRNGLIQFRDPALARRLADELFTDLIREQDRALMLTLMLGQSHGRDAAWDSVQRSWDAKIATMDPGGKQRAISAISQLVTKELARPAAAFLEAKRTPDTAETTARSLERLRVNAAAVERMREELPDALRRAGEAAPAG